MSVIPLPRSPHRPPARSTSALTVPIRDGVADLRPLAPGETDALHAVFDGLSVASRAARYLVPVNALTRAMRDALAAVDGENHIAWLAAVEGRPAGIARAVTVSPGTAEVAFEVVDDHHGRGLGAALLDAVTTVAAISGIRRLQASVLPSNDRSIGLLGRLGVRLRLSDGLLEGEGCLRLLDPARVDRAAVARLALASRGGPAPVWTADSRSRPSLAIAD